MQRLLTDKGRCIIEKITGVCIPLAFITTCMILVGTVQAQVTITRISGSNFFISTKIGTNNIGSMYAAYRVSNAGAALDDAWVKIHNFSGGVVSLAASETNMLQLGPIGSGSNQIAYLYLTATGTTTTPQSHTITVYNTRPDLPSATQLATANFTFTQVLSSIEASANKVDLVVHNPDPGSLGGVITMVVTGRTGTVGAGDNLDFSPASRSDWLASTYRLVSSHITFIALQGSNCGTTQLSSFADALSITWSQTSCYEATYLFDAKGITLTDTQVSPIVHVSSGTQYKHTDAGGYAALSPIPPVSNQVSLTKLVNVNAVSLPGAVTYTVRFTNAASSASCPSGNTTCNDILIDQIRDVLPSSPASASYVASSSYFNGSAISEPTISGQTLTWVEAFIIPAGSTRDLTYNVSIPATDGVYANSVIAFVSNEQIDTTTNTSDNAPASVNVTMTLDLDSDGIPDAVEDFDTDSDPSNDDADGDGISNNLDIDSDNDGITDKVEAGNTPTVPRNSDADSLPDYLDIDADADGIPDNIEAQSTAGYTKPSPTFTDIDNDGLDDVYDANTGSTDPVASAGLTPYNFDAADNPDYRDADSDNDGSPDSQEGHDFNFDANPDKTPSGSDTDSDGLDNGFEHISGYAPGNTNNPNNGINSTSADLPNHGGGAEVDFRNVLVLPVELVSFEAVANGNQVLLSWHTASETDNAGFEVHVWNHTPYASPDQWEVHGFVEGHATTAEPQNYRYHITTTTPGPYRFRLKQIDFDGTFAYSPVVEVQIHTPEGYLVEPAFPNPFNPTTQFRFWVQKEQQVRVDLYDTLGRYVQTLYAGKMEGNVAKTIRLQGENLSSGLYLIRVEGETFLKTQRVMLVK